MGWLRGIEILFLDCRFSSSPSVMRERAVGFCHLVRVLALLYGVSPVIGCIEQLGREPFGHRLFVALARGRNDPADAECLPARGTHFHRNLIGGATDAA